MHPKMLRLLHRGLVKESWLYIVALNNERSWSLVIRGSYDLNRFAHTEPKVCYSRKELTQKVGFEGIQGLNQRLIVCLEKFNRSQHICSNTFFELELQEFIMRE